MTTRAKFETLAVVCAAILVYVFGLFLLSEILGIKRQLEGVLLVPVSTAALYYLAVRPGTLRNPLIAFAVVKLILEIYWRGDFYYVAEGAGAVLALCVVWAAPYRSVRAGAMVVVWLAACFAAMGLVQWVVLFIWPSLGAGLPMSAAGPVIVSSDHPITYLGLFLGQNWQFLGRPVARLQSFTREPSLNLIFFCLPAVLALYLNTRWTRILACVMLAFSVLSFSGSVLLSLAFGAGWWILSPVLRVRFVLPWGILIVTAVYLRSVMTSGVQGLLDASHELGKINAVLAKSASITDRALSAVANFKIALVSPFGSPMLSDAAGPLFINAALAAGWIGIVWLALFLRRLGRRAEHRFRRPAVPISTQVATFLLLGALTTMVVFSDYATTTYPGLVLLMFLYRIDGDPRPVPATAARVMATA